MTDSAHVAIRPLERRDPPMLGAVMIHGRLASSDAGVIYAGQLVDQQVVVVTLTDGAESDSFGRARFDLAVQSVAEGASTDVLASDRAADVSPWVAFAVVEDWDGALTAAHGTLAAVTLADVEAVGTVQGPGFRPHWYRRRGVGRWRLWPLPWPSALTAAGRWTMLAAFGLMLTIAALALWLTTLVFQHQPTPPPPNPRVSRNQVPPPPPVSLPKPSTAPPSSGGTGSHGPPASGGEPSIM
jgi:hypothetical protein